MAIKLDMAHAYDRLEWKFLLQVLKCFSFNALWRQLIHQCISTVTFSILLNGSPHGRFQPSRGLRQGDPLSPFLFILASEVLSRLFYLEVRFGSLHGITAVRRAPPVTHLLFAGDLFIFCRANIRETREVDDILSSYCNWSGQLVNRQKSSIFFSPNTHPEVVTTLCNELRLQPMSHSIKYLGLPLFWGWEKCLHFAALKERIGSKLAGWKAKSLSQAGRNTLIKSVATSLPQYFMQSLLLPTGWCREVDCLFKDFWWGFSDLKKHNYTSKAWSPIC